MNAQKGFMELLEHDLKAFREQFDGADLPPQMAVAHEALPEFICSKTGEVDFRAEAGLKRGDAKLAMRHLLVTCTEKVMEKVQRLRLGICCRHNTAYLYNGAYWQPVEPRALEAFLGKAAERWGGSVHGAPLSVPRTAVEAVPRHGTAPADAPGRQRADQPAERHLRD